MEKMDRQERIGQSETGSSRVGFHAFAMVSINQVIAFGKMPALDEGLYALDRSPASSADGLVNRTTLAASAS